MAGTHERALDALTKRGRLRALEPRRGLDFASNDYLGLAQSSDLADAVRAAIDRGVPVGSGGSRLLRGNHCEHEALEAEAALHFRSETALYFGGGFMANGALLATLPHRGDLIVHDALIHASAHDGMRLSKAGSMSVPHNDPQAFDDAIATWRQAGGIGTPWIAVESLYSMDGDRAPLNDLIAIADRHDGVLLIDEAHATGVYGEGGRGLGAHLEGRPNVVTLHTCGKALGVMGGLVLGPAVYRDFLVNRARAFIYATAPSPLVAATVRAALKLVRDNPQRRDALQTHLALAARELTDKTGRVASGSQIIPVIVGSDVRAVSLAERLRALGFDVRAIRPPTVPEGTARLRITITLNTSADDIGALMTALATAEADLA